MPNENLRREGIVQENLPNATFRVKLDDDGTLIFAHLAGKMRLHFIKVLPGDKVVVEMTPYDHTKGRIVLRTKQ
ncbi:translation initiation factor IF-1 [Candidatus Azambacteria bacterium]|nr:translation initiation factor IF-1 [Candidatus Azambacteria bacterium]MBI3684806.1 translation initiation factor IF-1 [Candidatus Azambacteria bacterium]